jgi:hypothetical protein
MALLKAKTKKSKNIELAKALKEASKDEAHLNLYLSQKIYDKLKIKAINEKTSISGIVRKLIDAYVRNKIAA